MLDEVNAIISSMRSATMKYEKKIIQLVVFSWKTNHYIGSGHSTTLLSGATFP